MRAPHVGRRARLAATKAAVGRFATNQAMVVEVRKGTWAAERAGLREASRGRAACRLEPALGRGRASGEVEDHYFGGSMPGGYRHVQLLVRFRGVIWEVQLNTPAMLHAKKMGGPAGNQSRPSR